MALNEKHLQAATSAGMSRHGKAQQDSTRDLDDVGVVGTMQLVQFRKRAANCFS